MPTTKAELLARIEAGAGRWEALLAEVGEERLQRPGATGDWTVRDIAAHLNAWREWTLARLTAARDRVEPVPPWPAGMHEEDDEGVQVINDWFTERDRGLPAAQVLATSREQFRQMRAITADLSPDDLLELGRSPWLPGYALSDVVDGSLEHLDEHLASVHEWLAGTPASAQDASARSTT